MFGMRQHSQLSLAFPEQPRGEAPKPLVGRVEPIRAMEETESPADSEKLMEEVCERNNLKRALKRVRANRGAPGDPSAAELHGRQDSPPSDERTSSKETARAPEVAQAQLRFAPVCFVSL